MDSRAAAGTCCVEFVVDTSALAVLLWACVSLQFIKIGQQFSTRVDVLSPEFVKELEKLQVGGEGRHIVSGLGQRCAGGLGQRCVGEGGQKV